MGKKKTLLLDDHTIMLLQRYGIRVLGSDNISGAVRAMVRTESVMEAMK